MAATLKEEALLYYHTSIIFHLFPSSEKLTSEIEKKLETIRYDSRSFKTLRKAPHHSLLYVKSM